MGKILEKPDPNQWSHPDRKQAIDDTADYEGAFRNIIQSWDAARGIEPFREFADDQVAKLKSLYPEHSGTIDRLFKEVFP